MVPETKTIKIYFFLVSSFLGERLLHGDVVNFPLPLGGRADSTSMSRPERGSNLFLVEISIPTKSRFFGLGAGVGFLTGATDPELFVECWAVGGCMFLWDFEI